MKLLEFFYKKEKFIFSQRFEIHRLKKIVQSLSDQISDLGKQLEYYKEENFRKDDLLKGK